MDTVYHFLNFLFIPQNTGLHGADPVLLVSDQLLQLHQLRLQGLQGTICDADGKQSQGLINIFHILHLLLN